MIVFFGTYLIGRNNERKSGEPCEFCGTSGYVSSYDSFKFGHIFWIPILPLGGKKVINHCTWCKRYYQVARSKWDAAKRGMLDESEAEYVKDRMNLTAAARRHSALVNCDEREEAKKVAERMLEDFGDNAELLEHILRYYSANRVDDLSLKLIAQLKRINPDNSTAIRAHLTLLKDKPDQMLYKQTLLSLKDPDDFNDYYSIRELARQFADKGKFRDAYDLYSHICNTLPKNIEGNSQVKKEIRAIEKKLCITSSILSKM